MIDVLVTLNAGYFRQLVVMLVSLMQSNPQEQVTVHVMHQSLTPTHFETLNAVHPGCQARSVLIPVDFLADAPTTSRYPREMYYRIFSAQVLPKELERVLYLDPDLVVINSIRPLYDLPLGENLFAAASHLRSKALLSKVNKVRLALPSGASYVNSGVMVLNLALLRQQADEQRIFKYIRRHQHLLFLPDQDVLNAIYSGKILSVDTMRYNLSERVFGLYNLRPENWEHPLHLEWVENNCSIIHFCGRNKPWKDNYLGTFDCFYKKYEQLAIQKGLLS